MRFISLRRAASAATVILLTSAAHAQGVFKVQVTPTIVGRSGDILTMSYGVRVLRGSTDSLSMFLVDGPGTRLKVVEPSPSESWATRSAFQGHPGAAWMLLEELTRAGQATPALNVSGAGVLGVVTYWAIPDVPRDSVETDTPADTVIAKDTSVRVKGIIGKTIGIVVPPDQSVKSLVFRFLGQINQMRALGWIDDDVLCRRLLGNVSDKRPTLNALLAELEAQRGKHVSEQAYQVIVDNVRYILAKV